VKRVIVYSLLVCAAVAVAWLPPRTRTFDFGAVFYSPAREMVRRFGARARVETDALILLMQRDEALPNLEPLGSHAYHVGPALPTRLDAETRELLRTADSVPAHADAPGIAVSVVVDTLRRWEGASRIPPLRRARIYYLPPVATDGRTCLTVAAIGPDILQTVRETPADQLLSKPWDRRSLLGMCEYYHRFGVPSPTVDSWLLSGTISTGRNLLNRCAHEDMEACIAMLSPEVRSPWGVTFAAARGNPAGTLPSFGLLDDQFLSGLIDSLGTDRFQRFWTDPRPIKESFEAAFGIPVARWLHGWARARDPQQQVVPGPRPSARMLVLTLATIAGSLSWAVVARTNVLSRVGSRRK
jgi:hypothetical protein